METNSYHRLSIAPMMEITNNHFRNLCRLLTKETLLYTEMIHHDILIHSKRGYIKELQYDLTQKPIVVQLGGNDPELLQKSAIFCKEMGYDEINLNCGCPSNKVVNHNFGVCLMKNPNLVAECSDKMRLISNLEVSIKCRIGINNSPIEFLDSFIDTVNKNGNVNHFVMHARQAITNLDPVKNRKIPPLEHETIYQLKKKFPDINFSLNGGIKTLEEVKILLESNEMIGCMIGRAAYDNPWMLSNSDYLIYGKQNPNLSRKEIIYQYSDYCEKILNNEKIPFQDLTKPLTNLFAGEKHNNIYKQILISYKKDSQMSFPDHLNFCLEEYEKTNPEAVNIIQINNI